MNFLIKNGRVYDPATHSFTERNVAVVDGKLAEETEGIAYREVIDAAGCIVTTGLIDFHVHYLSQGTENGVNADASSFCMGITTAVDGGTCGVASYGLFHKTIVENSDTRILGDLLVASGGQSNDRYPENLDPKYFDEEKILAYFQKYRGELVGLKTRISKNIIAPEKAAKSLERTVEIADRAGVPVIVHITDCSLPLTELSEILRPGDVICHIYQNRGENTCLDPDGKVWQGLWKAKERGVLIDASNGRSNFDLVTCQAAVSQGYTPDIISSDNNCSSWFLQPMHTLPRILSKYMDFGVPLAQVLDTATFAPAKSIGRPELASMAVGTPADLCILKHIEKEVPYSDINGNRYVGTQVLVPQMTFKDGNCVYCQADFM